MRPIIFLMASFLIMCSFIPVCALGQTKDKLGNQDTDKIPKSRTQEKRPAKDTATPKYKNKWPDSTRKKLKLIK